jgi:hypothetical protein
MILIDDDRSVEATAVKDERIRKLFDHDGEVLEIGTERFEPGEFPRVLEERFAGLTISGVTATPVLKTDLQPVMNRAGTVRLYCAWLAAGSPPPD